MKNDELKALLHQYQNTAVGAFNGEIGQTRTELMDRYNAEVYGDEVKDRSQFVATDVRDTVESILPELMDIFFGGDKVVQFNPVGAEDVEAAEQETDVCNHVSQMNDGFMTFYSWFKDALIEKNGYVKRYWDERTVEEIEEYDDLTVDEKLQILSNINADEIEFLEQWDNADELLEESFGELPEGFVLDEATAAQIQASPDFRCGFKLKTTDELKEYKVEPTPPEEIRVFPRWHKLDFEGCPFVAHRRRLRVTDLIEMGFQRKQVEALPQNDQRYDTEEANSRFSSELLTETDLAAVSDVSMREVMVYENYVRADYDGDGRAELLQVYTAGETGEILKYRGGKLAIEPVDGTPFNVLCPVPAPHKHYGVSVAEMVTDLQRLKSVLVRQLVDNLLISNNPDVVVDENAASDDTYEDLMQTQPGRIIRVPGGMAAVGALTAPSTAQASLAGIEYVDTVREARTGVTRYNQGMDADSLNKTATGVRQIMSAAQKKILLIARIFAETGVKRLFLDMHRDLRKGPMRELALQLRNEWVSVNPRTWKTRTDMKVSVGLGTGNKEQQIQYLMAILQQQKEGMAAGMVTKENIHHTMTKIVELAGFKDPASFFPEPSELPEPQPQPDPAMALAEIEMQKNQLQAQMKANELQIKQLDILMKDDRERDLAAAKIEADEAARQDQEVNGQALTRG